MRLTKKRAIEISIELWEWLAETGNFKGYWPGWKKYWRMYAHCPLCEYGHQRGTFGCESCPYYKKFSYCVFGKTPYIDWLSAVSIRERKKHAKLFLEQLRQL